MRRVVVAAVFVALACFGGARAETPDEWVELGARVHGGFGAFIPLGIKIGLDAMKRLDAKPRELALTYYDSDRRRAPASPMASQSRSTRRSANAP